MNIKKMKKEYEPMTIRMVEFETEDVLSGSNGFWGEEEELSSNTVKINSDPSGGATQSQVNPT